MHVLVNCRKKDPQEGKRGLPSKGGEHRGEFLGRASWGSGSRLLQWLAEIVIKLVRA